MKRMAGLCFMLAYTVVSFAQDTLIEKTLDEVTVAASKWHQNRNEVSNKITKISRQQVFHYNPQTTADMLNQSGTVFVQKSQLGGGSPMIRGFATNRVLLVADGIRMNNAIYRSGNLQNVISIDPQSLENTEVIFGPGSLIYGSDAIGGVMDFRTLQPRFSTKETLYVSGSALARNSSANKEKTIHADIKAGSKRIAFVGSYSFSDFEDLKMGSNGPTQNYLRPEYVQRINNQDSIITNIDPLVQKFSGYNQHNFLGKLRLKANDHLQLEYSYTYARTGEAPRYDRLIQYRNGALRFAEWSYGPMVWKMHAARAFITKTMRLADDINIVAGYQDYKESRIDRTRNNNIRTTQSETVDAYNLNVDARKKLGKGELFYGFETVFNEVGSSGSRTNISDGAITPFASRYPDGSTWSTTGIYGSYKHKLSNELILTGGLRYSYNHLNASFDTSFVVFPFKKAELNDGALIGNIGAVINTGNDWQVNGHISTGYRMPNVDDIGKLFESTPGNLTVPNPDLKPEYAINFELGIVRNIINKFRLELNGFHTILTDAIARRPFTLNGEDSVDFAGVRSRVEALQNVSKALVFGAQGSVRYYFNPGFYLQANANWIWGEETDDVKDEQVPLRHAPPFYGSAHLHYQKNKLHAELYAFYNSEVKFKELAPTEQAKPDIYAVDKNGNPYSPEWYTINAKLSYQLKKNLILNAGWENITDQRYRSYSSGIVAAGSNLAFSIRVIF